MITITMTIKAVGLGGLMVCKKVVAGDELECIPNAPRFLKATQPVTRRRVHVSEIIPSLVFV